MLVVVVWPEVQAEARSIPGIEVLADGRTRAIAASFANRFVADPGVRWWWQSLREDALVERFPYGDDDPWQRMHEWLPEDRPLVLVATDEAAVPAGAVRGFAADLATLVRECSYFEYLVTDDLASFGIFDNHHNELIRIGPLAV